MSLYSGVGGQMDFIRGASLSEGGKPIIALPSITSKGEPRIVPNLKLGAGVVTTRAHVHYVVTEHGVANLERGKKRLDGGRHLGFAIGPVTRRQIGTHAECELALRAAVIDEARCRQQSRTCVDGVATQLPGCRPRYVFGLLHLVRCGTDLPAAGGAPTVRANGRARGLLL